VFPTLNSISIDHGVMEKLDRMAVVPASFGWSDVGSWQAAWELALKDERDNGAPEGTILVESNGNLVRALDGATSKKVYALVGVNDLVVVDTGDALLIMSKSHAQDVRKVVDALAAQERKETL
jgi:mannose-1-phosphate guanylyltransferase